MTNKEASEKLNNLGQDRQWLSTATGYSIHSINNAFSGEERPLKERMEKAFDRAFSEEERRREVDLTKPGASVWDLVYFNGLEVERIDRAKKAGGYSDLPSFYRDAVIEFADGLLRAESAPANVTPLQSRREELEEAMQTLPFYGLVAAGNPGGPIDVAEDEIAVPGEWDRSSHFVLRVNGESMEPDYPDRSLIVCRRLKTGEFAKKGDDVIASDPSGGYFKRLAYTKDGKKGDTPRKPTPHLTSINPDYSEVVPLSDLPIVAVVAGKLPVK